MISHVYEQIIEQPAVPDWPCVVVNFHGSHLQTLRSRARLRLFEAAHQYSTNLARIANTRGVESEAWTPGLDRSPGDRPIVMTGHQPVIFHSGLTYKYEAVDAFAARNDAIGIALVIDSDEGDAGEFACPMCEFEASSEKDVRRQSADTYPSGLSLRELRSLITQKFSLASAPAMHSASIVKPLAELRSVSDCVHAYLKRCSCNDAATHFSQAISMYEKLNELPMLEANLIARRAAGIGAGLMEIRLSHVCGLPECIQFFGEVLSRPFAFARQYNSSLEQFRREHKIQNQANPFPTLAVSDDECELPFWFADLKNGSRDVPVIRRVNGVPVFQTANGLSVEMIPGHEAAALFSLAIAGTPLIPRGALITATMRLLFSDLFVHGTGGGRYDQFTTQFIQQWWSVDASPIAVASASRYMFEEERQEVANLERTSIKLRDLQFNPQRYIGEGVFSSALEKELTRLLAEKNSAVSELKQAKAAALSAEDAGRRIQKLSDEIRQGVLEEFRPRIEALQHLPSQAIDTVRNRTWPWFYFSR